MPQQKVSLSCLQSGTKNNEIPRKLYLYEFCTHPSCTFPMPCMLFLVLWWFLIWGLFTACWILSICLCRQVIDCSYLTELQLLLALVVSCLHRCCTCPLVEHGKLKKPWMWDKHYLSTTKPSVYYHVFLILKTKYITLLDTRKVSVKINSIPDESISRCKFIACSLSLQQTKLLMLRQTAY